MPYETTKPYFKLFANCIAVKGAKRSTVCDLMRGNIHFIPNDLYGILQEYKNKSLDEIYADYESEIHANINGYFDFLEKNELGFWCSEPQCYPDLDLSWDAPGLITNAIIDVDENSNHDFKNIFTQLHQLGCKGVQLRCYAAFPLKKLHETLELLLSSRLSSIEIFIKHSEECTIEAYKTLASMSVVTAVYIHSASFDDIEVVGGGSVVKFTQTVLESSAHCGIINSSYFISNINVFTEAQQHNTCLNRKISIDVNGDIKNCPSMAIAFGNICNTKLADVVQNEEFRFKWVIKKDQIEICKDCEFRYVCTDCRAYTQNSGDQYSKPLKCNYDPYTATWN